MNNLLKVILLPMNRLIGTEHVEISGKGCFESAIEVSCIESYACDLQGRYQAHEPWGQAPVSILLGKAVLSALKDLNVKERPEGIPEITNDEEMDIYRERQKGEREFFYINESIAGKHPCTPSLEPLVNLGELAQIRGVKLIIAPVEERFDGAIYLRDKVAEAVLQAAEAILKATSGEITLKIFDGYRALEDQERIFNQYYKQFTIAMPNATEVEIWNQVTQVVADPKLVPPHSTGGALDLTLVWTKTGEELDMGTGVNYLDDKAATWTKGLNPEQEYNRLLLVGTMVGAGFFNLPTEFWHYSIGDPYHALFCGDERAQYSTIHSLNEHPVVCTKFNKRSEALNDC